MNSSIESSRPSGSSGIEPQGSAWGWRPFRLCPPDERPPAPRAIDTREGVGDRLRTAAFAELQAREAFAWAAGRYGDAPEGLRRAWEGLAASEHRHLLMILERMRVLGIATDARPVSDALWRSLTACPDAASFARWMRRAEERGKTAEERFAERLTGSDPETASMFAEIAREEAAHIAVADRYFPERGLSGGECPA
ncbi:MAG: DUF455 family protein [Elusimicrobia bacterium]|nr:DUF455 family protein [Elusimicrobiota bacterium]